MAGLVRPRRARGAAGAVPGARVHPPGLPPPGRRPGALPAAVRGAGAASPARPMGMSVSPVWIVVLVKDFEQAKQRLRPALDPGQRRELARENARLALAAARAGDRVLAVCGSEAAAELARQAGAEVLLEAHPAGQNPAARLGIEHASARGAQSVLLLSSD